MDGAALLDASPDPTFSELNIGEKNEIDFSRNSPRHMMCENFKNNFDAHETTSVSFARSSVSWTTGWFHSFDRQIVSVTGAVVQGRRTPYSFFGAPYF